MVYGMKALTQNKRIERITCIIALDKPTIFFTDHYTEEFL